MPRMCFSYQPDVPPGIGTRAVAPRTMPAGSCFSDMVDVPQPASAGYLHCFSYSVDVPQPVSAGWLSCFSYTADAPQPAPPGLRRMSYTTCFRY
jgi:hypothetical protein